MGKTVAPGEARPLVARKEAEGGRCSFRIKMRVCWIAFLTFPHFPSSDCKEECFYLGVGALTFLGKVGEKTPGAPSSTHEGRWCVVVRSRPWGFRGPQRAWPCGPHLVSATAGGKRTSGPSWPRARCSVLGELLKRAACSPVCGCVPVKNKRGLGMCSKNALYHQ